jgi:predicted Zn-dependent protease with MMP-like domain
MTPTEFEQLVDEALHQLPDWVREAFDNIDVQISEEADAELDPDGEGLLGLYLGVPLPERGVDYAFELPDVIHIFRKPHLELELPPDELRAEVVKTLLHEIAHYFGIEDDYLDEIGWG